MILKLNGYKGDGMSEMKMWDDMDKWELIAEIKSTRKEMINGWRTKVGQMTDEEVLNDIELLVGALKGEDGERTTKLKKENFRLQLQISKIESICFDTWEEEDKDEHN
jgi:hypothetical protein